jgi:hypothetical protein
MQHERDARAGAPAGKRAQALVNGDQIFADMLKYQPTFFHCKVMIVDELWTATTSPPRPEQRPWTEKLWEHTMGLFSSQL